MERWILTACLLGAALANPSTRSVQSFHVDFTLQGETQEMVIVADSDKNVITYDFLEGDVFEDSKTFEDYDLGYGASLVVAKNCCIVQALSHTFDEQVAIIQASPQNNVNQSMDKVATPLEDDDEISHLGERIKDFCNGHVIYQFTEPCEDDDFDGDDDEDEDSDPDRRQVSVTFNRCFISCFLPVCYSTTLTIPTGSTITFGWFFFG